MLLSSKNLSVLAVSPENEVRYPDDLMPSPQMVSTEQKLEKLLVLKPCSPAE